MALMWGCTNTSNKLDTPEISNTQRQREVCLDWYGYRIDTKKAINDLNLKIKTESEYLHYYKFLTNLKNISSRFPVNSFVSNKEDVVLL